MKYVLIGIPLREDLRGKSGYLQSGTFSPGFANTGVLFPLDSPEEELVF